LAGYRGETGEADGIASHDTLSAVFRQLDPVAFSQAFSDWSLGLAQRTAIAF